MSAVVAIAMVAVTQQEFSLSHALLLCSCSIITSSIASLLLGNITSYLEFIVGGPIFLIIVVSELGVRLTQRV
jgi:hypothetical protein